MKVTDLTKEWTPEINKACMMLIRELDALVEEYANIPADSTDIVSMEKIKRLLTAKLLQYSTYYSIVRSHFENNTYLNGLRKQIQSETFNLLIQQGESATSADKKVYAHPFYAEKWSLLLQIRERFILIDDKYKRYIQAERAISQSISILNKEYNIK